MPATAQQISEKTYSQKPLRVDREKGVIYNVRLLGEKSLNGRDYSLKSRESSARLYEEMPVNLDHSEDPGGAGRSISDNIGVVRGSAVKKDDGAVYGDFHYITSHPMADAIAERAEKFPTTFGFSHDAVGEVSEGAGRDGNDLVEDIIEVNSVDLVSNPATNKSISESRSNPMAKTVKKTVRKILEANKADNKLAASLLELDDFAMMAEAPVEVAPEAKPEDQIKAAFRAMVMAAFDDESLDMAATVARIKEILKAQDKLGSSAAPEGATDTAAEGNTGHGGELEKPALESFRRQLESLTRRQLVTDVLESEGLTRKTLQPAQLKLIEKQTSESDMREIIEGLDIKPSSIPLRKPAIGSVLSESMSGGSKESYDELIEGRTSSRHRRRA